MPVGGAGWELLIRRIRTESRGSKSRTVGSYQAFHDGVLVPAVAGHCLESPGPGDNSVADNGRRVEAGIYPLLTQAGTKYVTIDYTPNANHTALPRPGLELGKTGARTEILIHPGRNFLWSVGCINLAGPIVSASDDMDFTDSRARVIGMINDLRGFLGGDFPTKNGKPIPRATVVIEGEP